MHVLDGLVSRVLVVSFWQVPKARWFPEKTHWWIGRFIVALSVVVVYLGIMEYK